MTEERRVSLVAEVDTTQTQQGFNQIGQQAGAMAQQVTQAGTQAATAVNRIGQQAATAGQQVTQAGAQAATAVGQIGQQATATAQQVTAAGAQAATAVGNVGAGAATSSRNVDAAQRNIIASIQRTTVAMQAGGRQTAAYYEAMARQRGVDPAALAPFIAQLRALEQAQAQAAASANTHTAAMGHVGLSAAQVQQELRFLPNRFQSIADSITAGQRPMTIFIQQGGELVSSFGGVTTAAKAVGGYLLGLVNPFTVAALAVGAVAYAYNEGSKESENYNAALILSGNTAGTTASQMAAMAKQIAALGGTQSDAAAALTALARTGQVGAQNLQAFATTAVSMEHTVGQSVDETAKQFAELAKAPLDASVKLNDSYHYLTAAVYDQIKALEQQGRTQDAGEAAQKAYSTAMDERTKKLKDNLSEVEKSWQSVGNVAKKAWDQFLNVGRPQTIDDKIAEIDAQIARASKKEAPIPSFARLGLSQSLPGVDVETLKTQRAALEMQKAKEEWDAAQAAISQQMSDLLKQWDKDGDKYLTKIQQRDKEIARVRQEGLDAGVSDADINKRIAQVYSQYASLDNPALAKLEGDAKLQKAVLDGQLDTLESNYRQQLVTESSYITQKRDLQVAEINLEIGLAQKRAGIDKGKEDQSAYQKDLTDLKVLVQQRQNIITGATNAIGAADAARKKAIDNLVGGWDRAIDADTQAVAQDIALFGQSDQARQVAIAQIKLESDARKLIADQAKDGHALSQQEIDDLMAKTKARQASTAEVMNEKAAIAGAQQLLQENRKFSVEYVADEQERADRTLEIDAQQWRELINNTAEGSEARKKLMEQFDQWYANRQMTPVLDKWKGVIDGLDNDFRDGFRDMLSGGQDMWSSFAKSIGNTLKTSLATALYDTFIKKYVVQIVTSFAGAISGPAVAGALTGSGTGGAAAGAAGSAISLAQTASSLYKLVSGGFTGISDAVAGGVQSAMSSLGYTPLASQGLATASGQALTPLASGLGSVASIGAGVLAGYGIGTTISGQYGSNSTVAAGTAIGAYVGSVVPVIGTALGAALGGVLGGVTNRLFGMGDKEVTSEGIRGTLTADTLTGENYSDWHQDGGLFRSDKSGTDTSALSAATVAQFTQGLAAIESASSGFAKSLGVSADWVSSYSKTFDITLTGDSTKDQQAITDFFNGVGDEIANKLVPNLAEFTKTGETASATLERLAGDFQGTDQVAQLLGTSASTLFGADGMDSAKARENLINVAGGLSTLSSEAQSFNQNFLTDAERIAPVSEALDKALGSLGLSTIPTTRDQFKALITSLTDSGAAATEAGAQQLSSLLALSDAFATVHPDTTAAKQQLQDQLDDLLLTPAQQLAKQRAALPDDETKALFDQVQAAQAAKDALETHNSELDLLAQTYALTGNKAGAAAVLEEQHAIALAALDPALRGATQNLWDLQAAATAAEQVKTDSSTLLSGVDNAYSTLETIAGREKDLLQTRIDTENDVVSKLQTLSQSIHSTLDSLSVPGADAYMRQAAQAQIRAALAVVQGGGTLTDAQNDALTKALSTVTQDSTKLFSSQADYLYDYLTTRNDVAQLGSVTDSKLTDAQAQLQQLQDQSKSLDAVLTTAQEQVNVLKGISTTGISIEQAIYGLQVAIGSAQQNPVVSASSAINDAYQSALGRAPDADGLAYWQGQAAAGVSTSAITGSIASSREAQIDKLYESVLGRPADAAGLSYWVNSSASLSEITAAMKTTDEYKHHIGVPGYANGGDFAGGVRMVGEIGPEVEATGAARIHSTQALINALRSPSDSNSVLADAVKSLQAENAKQREVIEEMAKDMATMAGILKGAAPGGNFIRTKAVS